MRRETFNVLTYNEFNDLVNRNVPNIDGAYEFVAYEEALNDSCYKYEHIGEVGSHPDTALRIEDMLANRRFMYGARLLLEYLYMRGVIESGNYLITVSW